MSSSYIKRRPFHIVVRGTRNGKVVARTRLRGYVKASATREFERLCRLAQNVDAFKTTSKYGPVRIELYEGPSSARHNKRLIAMAGDFGAPKIVDYLGLLRPKSDMHVADILPGLENGVLGLDPRNAEFDGSVLDNIPFFEHGRDFDGDALNSGQDDFTIDVGEISQAEHREVIRKMLTEDPEGPAPKPRRPQPIRLASDFELAAWAGALSDGVSSSRKQMFAGHIAQRLAVPLTPGELNVIQATGRQERQRSFINHALTPFGVILKTVDESSVDKVDINSAEMRDLIYSHYEKQNPDVERARFDDAYEKWLAQRDRDVELAVTRSPLMRPSTMDKIRHNCEDPKTVHPLALIWKD